MDATTKITVNATGFYHQTPDQPMGGTILAYFDAEAEAQEFLARFPKSYRGIVGGVCNPGHQDTYRVEIDAHLTGNDSNKGVNETGLKRLRNAMKKLAKMGDVEITENTTCSNEMGLKDLLDHLATLGI